MNGAKRRLLIFEQLKEAKSVEVKQLAKQYEVSPMTIRRDLSLFAKQGLVSLNYGGAILNEGSGVEASFSLKAAQAQSAKAAIAKEAARLVNEGETILLDCGTTTYEMAKYLSDKAITVITNSWKILQVLQNTPKIKVILAPGTYSRISQVAQVQIAIGDDTLQTMPNGTPIPAVLNRKIGINNFLTSTSALHDSDAMTVFYTKEVMDKTFYVPKTKRVSANLSDVDAYIDAILADVSVNSSLKQPLAQEKVKTTAASVMRENVLQVHLDNRILAEDQTAKKQAYETLILSLCMLDHVEQVQVLVDDVAVTLHGMNDRSCSAAELIYNEIE